MVCLCVCGSASGLKIILSVKFGFMKSSMNTHDEAVEIDSVDRQPRIVFLFGRRSVIKKLN